MENIEKIKNTNKALIASNIILGCLLILAMALLAVNVIEKNKITANAAAENLLNEAVEITINENYWNYTNVELDLNITVGNTYTILYSTDGGEKATVTSLCFDETAENNGNTSLGTFGENRITLNTGIHILYIAKNATTDDGMNITDNEGYSTFILFTDTSNPNTYATVWGIYEGTEAGEAAPLPKQSNEDLNAGTIVEEITGSFTTFLTGTGTGIVDFFDSVFTNEEGGISVLAIVALSLMGLGLATGLIKYIVNRV